MKSLLIISLATLSLSAFSQTFSQKPNFQELNEKIIKPKCLQCHNEDEAAREVYLVTYDDVKFFGVAGRPDQSSLYVVLTEEAKVRMPYKRDPLSTAEMNYVKAWINAGMPEK